MIHFATFSCFGQLLRPCCFGQLLRSVASVSCFDPAALVSCFDPAASPRPDTTVRCPCPSHRFFVTDSCPGLSSWSVVSVRHFGLALRPVATASCAMAVWSSGTFPLSMSSGDFRRSGMIQSSRTFPLSMSSGDFRRSGMIQSSRTFAESVPKSIS